MSGLAVLCERCSCDPPPRAECRCSLSTLRPQAPFLGDFDENFTFNELRAMERLVLKALQWSLCYSTPYDFTYYWMGAEKLRGSEREKTNELCHEAISKCTIGPQHGL